MRQKTEKKLVSFSHLNLINKLVGDDAAANRTTESRAIEDRLLASYLPSNKNGAIWILYRLYDEENGSLQKAMHAIFSYNGADMINARYINLKPLVEYSLELSIIEDTPIDYLGNGEIEYITTYMDMFKNRFDYELEHLEKDAELRIYSLKVASNEMTRLIDLLRKNHEIAKTVFHDIYFLINNNWDTVCEWGTTYRLLQSLVDKESWRMTPDRRYKLRALIKQVTDEWDNN